MIKAIVFDCFGVLTTEGWLPFKAKYFGHDPELFEQAGSIGWQANMGRISYGEFMQAVAKLAGITPEAAARAIERNVPDEELFAYIAELKQKKYKLGLLSNAAGDHLSRIFTKRQLGLFDAVTLSYRNGFTKPERRAFETAAEQLGVGVEECVFVDDQERNVSGSRAAGMQAVLYRDAVQLRRELKPLLGKI